MEESPPNQNQQQLEEKVEEGKGKVEEVERVEVEVEGVAVIFQWYGNMQRRAFHRPCERDYGKSC